MKIKEHKQRAWVRKHQRNLPQLHAQVSRRLQVLRDKLWRGDPKPFALLLQGVLGLEPASKALPRAMLACWELKGHKVCLGNYLNLILVASALSYFNRRDKGSTKVLVYNPLSHVPADYLHLLDFTPVELGRQLDTAIKVHGIGREYNFIFNWLRETSFSAEPPAFSVANAYKAEARRNDFLGKMYSLRSPDLVTKKIHLSVQRMFTAESEASGAALARNFKQARAAALPLAHSYDAERLISLKAEGGPQAGCGNILAQALLLWGRGESSALTPDLPGKLPAFAASAAPAKGTPEEIYLLASKIIERRKYVQAVRHQRSNSSDRALPECRKRYPGLTLGQLKDDAIPEGSHLTPALCEAGKAVGRGEAYALKLYKRAAANARVNLVWSVYLSKFSSFKVS